MSRHERSSVSVQNILRFVRGRTWHIHVAFTRHLRYIQRVRTTYRSLFGGNVERDRERR